MSGTNLVPRYDDYEKYDRNPHKESLNDIIDEILALRDENDFHYNASRRAVILNARRGLRELHLNASREVRALRFTIPDSGIVRAPLDMIEPIRVSVLDENGFLWPLYENDQVKITQEYVLDSSDEIVFDNNGYFVTSDTTAFFNNTNTVVSTDGDYGYINIANEIDKFNELQFVTYQLKLVNTATNEESYQTVTYSVPGTYNGVTIDSVKDFLESSDFLNRVASLDHVTSANIGQTPGTSLDDSEGFHIELETDWEITGYFLPRIDLNFPTTSDYSVFKVNPAYFDSVGQGGATGATGGINIGSGYFQFYRQYHEFRFFNNIADNVVIEYVSDPFLEETLDNLRIHKYFVEALKAYIYYNIISSKSNIPMNEKERARRRWGTEYKNARKKIGFNNVDRINQILRRSRNRDKW